MTERYLRNRLYLTADEQNVIKNYPILLAGSGIGSNIAECALRFGFENITIIDGDIIESSNLNRQNYTNDDVSMYKAESLYHRLKDINPEANIRFKNEFITLENIKQTIEGSLITINALDFSSDIPILFDKVCQEKNITVLHPYNLGWAGLVTVIAPNGENLEMIGSKDEINELKVVEFISEHLKYSHQNTLWLSSILLSYKEEKEILPPPQLSIGSWLVAAMCTNILYKIATNKKFKQFPEYYFSSTME